MADKSVRGRFVWHDLVTSDTAAAQAFYTKVLSWKTEAWEQDPSYTMFAAASGPLGGTVSDASGQPHWIAYIGTENLQSTIDQADKSFAGGVPAFVRPMYQSLVTMGVAVLGMVVAAESDAIVLVHDKSISPTESR